MNKVSSITVTIFLFGILGTAFAQQLQVGKVILAKSKTTVKTSIQMQPNMDMEVPIFGESLTEITILSALDELVKGEAVLKKIKGAATIMGQEQTFDSDNQSTVNNPLVQNMFKLLSTKVPFTINKGKVEATLTTAELVQSNGSDIVWKLVLPANRLAQLKENFNWVDSIGDRETGSSALLNFNVAKISNQEIWIDGIAEVKFNNTLEQMGMQMKQNLIGIIKFKRIYTDKGLLKSEIRTTNLSGKMDAMDQQMPIKMVGNLETVVE